jgi:putative hydrolase of the HAD superfamily
MFPFDVILFDVGGVLLTNGWDHRERALTAEYFHLDLAELEARHPVPYTAWESGAIPLKAYLDAVVFYQPRNFSQDDFYGFMLNQSKLLPDGALRIVEELAASHQCMLGALNNEARETNEFRFESFGLRPYFSVALSSCYLGLRKPDPAMYQRALDILGRPAERILFIDDRVENVAAAEGKGIQAIWFEGAEALRSRLVSIGVL